MKMWSITAAAVGAALLSAMPLSLQWSQAKTLSVSVDTASARIGHPLTPMSVAGVGRRAGRRAYRRNTYYNYAAGYPRAHYYHRPYYP
jgi:hypothetical protein